MLKIWGRNNSVNVQKVLWCCEELGLKYERLDAGGSFGVVNTPQYRALNPNGLVPTIEDGPFVLWESNAILRYLTAKHSSGKLWPEDHKVRAEADKTFDASAAKYDAQEKEAIEFFKKEGKEVYTPDQNAFRTFAQKKYLDKYASEWPKGVIEKINTIK